jgi:hypothetical protein
MSQYKDFKGTAWVFGYNGGLDELRENWVKLIYSGDETRFMGEYHEDDQEQYNIYGDDGHQTVKSSHDFPEKKEKKIDTSDWTM